MMSIRCFSITSTKSSFRPLFTFTSLPAILSMIISSTSTFSSNIPSTLKSSISTGISALGLISFLTSISQSISVKSYSKEVLSSAVSFLSSFISCAFCGLFHDKCSSSISLNSLPNWVIYFTLSGITFTCFSAGRV